MFIKKGAIKKIFNEENPSDKFKYRNFVLYVDGMYPNELLFQCVQARCGLLDNLKEYDEVSVTFDVHGKSFTNKNNELQWTNTLVVLSISKS